MLLIFSDYLENASVSDVIYFYWNAALLYFTDLFAYLHETSHQTLPSTFDDFQWDLLRIFAGLILFNLLSILIVWKLHGESIYKQFMTNPTLREIEELKASVSKLKLPKEHSPRI
ncbi:unnamed protein product [Phyllotreta striolata]|uniref:Uncharacterized protein n=1 Tax=Phyllotreta striolata TaxID=444603 RepID=A0A9N9TKP5_PHYSR|nr:unnamed protein product [Phyllotreta striolata]